MITLQIVLRNTVIGNQASFEKMTHASYNTLEPTEPQFISTYSDDSERESLLSVDTKTANDEPVRGYKNRSIVAFLVFAIIGVTVLVSTNSSRKIEVTNVSDMQTHLTGTKKLKRSARHTTGQPYPETASKTILIESRHF